MLGDTFLTALRAAEERDARRHTDVPARRAEPGARPRKEAAASKGGLRRPAGIAHLQAELGYSGAKQLASGAFADVFSARAADGTRVALKCFRSQRAHALRMFRAEVEALSLVPRDATCVTKMIACRIVSPAHPVIVLELGGTTLRAYVSALAGSCLYERASLVAQLVNAVRYLHFTVAACHRDLKPENVLVAAPCQIRLCDFGLAKSCDEVGRLHTICGSLAYMSPELLSDAARTRGYFGFPVDIWALGVVVYEIMERRPPFAATSFDGMCRAIRKGVHRPFSAGIHVLFRKLIDDCLRAEPRERPRARELRIPIFRGAAPARCQSRPAAS